MLDKLVQYIIIRNDLSTVLKWSKGSIIAQACHASAACFHEFKDDPNVQNYLSNTKNMTTIVLKISDEAALINLQNKISKSNIDFVTWIEQPENIPSCIAIKPYTKNSIQDHFKSLTIYN